MATWKESIEQQIVLEDTKIENVTEFTYLGSLVTLSKHMQQGDMKNDKKGNITKCQSSRKTGKSKALVHVHV